MSPWLLPLVCVALLVSASTWAQDAPSLPRFASLGKDEIFARTGPALQYPIRWVYKRRGLPIEIVREYDTWRQVRDMDGAVGWVHHAMLSGYRNAIILPQAGVTLTSDPDPSSGPVVRLERGVVVNLDTCEPAWCRVRISGFKGWVPRAALWGIYPNEEIR